MSRSNYSQKLLFINCQEIATLKALNISHAHWIADGLDLPRDKITTINVADNEQLPKNVTAFDGIIGGGSAHSAYENLPWMQKTGLFFKLAYEVGVPQLLSCFSHQLFAETLGGEVSQGSKGRRFGIETLTLTEQGKNDPLFEGLEATFELFTSHGDIVNRLPRVGKRRSIVELANTSFYHHEALSYGSKTRTIQAHPELSAHTIYSVAYSRAQEDKTDGSHLLYKTYVDSPLDQKKLKK